MRILLEIARGDSRNLLLRIRNKYTEEMLNLSPYVVYFVMKKKITDNDADAVFVKTSENPPTEGIEKTNPENGEAMVYIQSSETLVPPGDYFGGVRVVEHVATPGAPDIVFSDYDDPVGIIRVLPAPSRNIPPNTT